VLITLQPKWQESEPIQFLINSPKDFFWWVRLHPRMHEQREMVRNFLKNNNIKYYNLDIASDFPLPLILKNIHIHLTTISSVIIEAMKFGVQTIFTDHNAKMMFPQEIELGYAIMATSQENILKKLLYIKENLIEFKKTEKNVSEEIDPKIAILTIIEQSKIAKLTEKKQFAFGNS
jgi:hypothetical protein